MSKVAIIGGGAAGIMAAIWALRNNNNVTIYEKNEKVGKKIFITGKGRCNFTNACEDIDTLFDSVITNSKFLYSAFYSFDNNMAMSFFEDLGMKYKIERGERAFPISDHSSDVIKALSNEIDRLGGKVLLNSTVNDILVKNGIITGIKVNDKVIDYDKVILATGGISYPNTGSTGDGIRYAKATGHSIEKMYPSLVPIEVKEKLCSDLMGLSLKNVSLSLESGSKVIYKDLGEMLFTHFGVSGPLVLSASSHIHKYLQYISDKENADKRPMLYIDFKPALTVEQLDKRLIRDFDKYKNKQYKNALDDLLPKKLIPYIIEFSGINPDKKVNEISKTMRLQVINSLKRFPLTITGLRGYNEAIITKGGVSVKDIDPSTMESKKIKNLYMCGEMLDLDALTGGFNLQIAWSTGYLAGTSV